MLTNIGVNRQNVKLVTQGGGKVSVSSVPVPGHSTLAANLMARAWNQAPNLQTASSLGAAKSAAHKWAKSLPFTN